MDFSAAFQKNERSVVNIISLNAQQKMVSSGSGVVIGEGDLVLTCAHCIIPGLSTVARFSGENTLAKGEVILRDEQADVALIEFESPIGQSASLTTSSSVLVGHEIFVAGFPNGISQLTALFGNVAGIEKGEQFNYIRIDASINHGNSGGPLFNSDGEVVGVVNAKHGVLSNFLQSVQRATPGASMSIGGINPVQVMQQLIGEMGKNLNLGIGYAIPIDHIGSLDPRVEKVIK